MSSTLKNEDMSWLGVDLDWTLAKNTGFPDFELGEPIEGAKEAVDSLVSKGYKIIIYTARPWADYQLIESWLFDHEIPHRRIVCGKVLVKWLIDDRAISFNNWSDTLTRLEELDG